MALHKSDFLRRIKKLETAYIYKNEKVYVFNIYDDFIGPKAMKKELSKRKYRGCVIILNDIP